MAWRHQNEEKSSLLPFVKVDFPVHNLPVTKMQHCDPQKLLKHSQLIWKGVRVYVCRIVFQSWWPDIAVGLFKSDTETGYVKCLLTNNRGVSSLFKRKNTCKTFSKPFTLQCALFRKRQKGPSYKQVLFDISERERTVTISMPNTQLLLLWFTKPWFVCFELPCCEVRWPEKSHGLESSNVVL